MGREVPSIPEKVMDALKRWSWPGNIRELQNVIERAVILSGPSLVLPPQDVQPMARRCRLERETCHDVQRGRTRRDSSRVEGIGRRHRRADRRGRAARPQPDHAALEDAAAGHSAALLLNA